MDFTMNIQPYTLEDFVMESNKIEGIEHTTDNHIQAHKNLIEKEKLTMLRQ